MIPIDLVEQGEGHIGGVRGEGLENPGAGVGVVLR